MRYHVKVFIHDVTATSICPAPVQSFSHSAAGFYNNLWSACLCAYLALCQTDVEDVHISKASRLTGGMP